MGGVEVLSYGEACERLGVKMSSLTVYLSQGKLVRAEGREKAVTVASVEAYEARRDSGGAVRRSVPNELQPGQELPGLAAPRGRFEVTESVSGGPLSPEADADEGVAELEGTADVAMCPACGYDEPEHAPMCVRHPERARMVDELLAERQGDEVEEPLVDDDGRLVTEADAHRQDVQATFGEAPAGDTVADVRRREQEDGPASVRIPDVDVAVSSSTALEWGRLEGMVSMLVLEAELRCPTIAPDMHPAVRLQKQLGEVALLLEAQGVFGHAR